MYGYKHHYFSLNISKEQLLAVYSGAIHSLRVRTESGIVVELDANYLRQYTTNDGIKGRFVLTTTSTNKFVSLNKV